MRLRFAWTLLATWNIVSIRNARSDIKRAKVEKRFILVSNLMLSTFGADRRNKCNVEQIFPRAGWLTTCDQASMLIKTYLTFQVLITTLKWCSMLTPRRCRMHIIAPGHGVAAKQANMWQGSMLFCGLCRSAWDKLACVCVRDGLSPAIALAYIIATCALSYAPNGTHMYVRVVLLHFFTVSEAALNRVVLQAHSMLCEVSCAPGMWWKCEAFCLRSVVYHFLP